MVSVVPGGARGAWYLLVMLVIPVVPVVLAGSHGTEKKFPRGRGIKFKKMFGLTQDEVKIDKYIDKQRNKNEKIKLETSSSEVQQVLQHLLFQEMESHRRKKQRRWTLTADPYSDLSR